LTAHYPPHFTAGIYGVTCLTATGGSLQPRKFMTMPVILTNHTALLRTLVAALGLSAAATAVAQNYETLGDLKASACAPAALLTPQSRGKAGLDLGPIADTQPQR